MSLLSKLTDKKEYKGTPTSLLGTLPSGPLKDPSTKTINDSFNEGTYTNHLVKVASGTKDIYDDISFGTRSTDQTSGKDTAPGF